MFTKNKKINIFLIAFFVIAAMTGCKKSFLDVAPQGQLTQTEVALNPDAAKGLVSGVYNTLYFGGFDKTTVGFLWVIATDVASDDGDKGSFDADFGPAKEIDNFTHTSNNFIFNNIWNGYYAGIARANQAIKALEASSFDATVKNRLLGEVRFIRGMYYFNLVRFFGGVPLITRVASATEANNDEFQTRSTKDQVYTAVLADLQFAVDNLPLKGDPNTETGRANKGAAEALLAKVYLYQKNYQKAFDLTKDIINSGKYSLVSDYSQNFKISGNNNSESIFEIQTGITANCDAVSPLFTNGQGARAIKGWNDLGFGLNNPTLDLANAFEPGDTRNNATIIYVTPTVSAGPNPGTILYDGFRIPTQDSVQNPRYSYKAHELTTCNGSKDLKPKNIRLIRYAEVLLIYAEAASQIANAGEALSKLNLVRARAALTASASATQADIWKERRVELAMEQDRFFDLVRQGRAGVVLRAHGKAFTDGKNELFPIPQNQIDLSGGRLKQNPGYQ
jgi:tetratricopeptide (TPR) repeat protein